MFFGWLWQQKHKVISLFSTRDIVVRFVLSLKLFARQKILNKENFFKMGNANEAATELVQHGGFLSTPHEESRPVLHLIEDHNSSLRLGVNPRVEKRR